MMHRGHCPEAQRLYDKARDTIAAIKRTPEPRDAIICEECGRALAGIVELVDHYLLRHGVNAEHNRLHRKKAA
jgi:hypothetical protein